VDLVIDLILFQLVIIIQNYDILFAHQGMINVRTMLNNPINCFIEIRNVTPGPIQGTLNITNFV